MPFVLFVDENGGGPPSPRPSPPGEGETFGRLSIDRSGIECRCERTLPQRNCVAPSPGGEGWGEGGTNSFSSPMLETTFDYIFARGRPPTRSARQPVKAVAAEVTRRTQACALKRNPPPHVGGYVAVRPFSTGGQLRPGRRAAPATEKVWDVRSADFVRCFHVQIPRKQNAALGNRTATRPAIEPPSQPPKDNLCWSPR